MLCLRARSETFMRAMVHVCVCKEVRILLQSTKKKQFHSPKLLLTTLWNAINVNALLVYITFSPCKNIRSHECDSKTFQIVAIIVHLLFFFPNSRRCLAFAPLYLHTLSPGFCVWQKVYPGIVHTCSCSNYLRIRVYVRIMYRMFD